LSGKLSDEDVRLMRALDRERLKHRQIAESITRKKIAEKFGVSPSRVYDICEFISYRHVDD
jgi:AraC-like DNA-binding protein